MTALFIPSHEQPLMFSRAATPARRSARRRSATARVAAPIAAAALLLTLSGVAAAKWQEPPPFPDGGPRLSTMTPTRTTTAYLNEDLPFSGFLHIKDNPLVLDPDAGQNVALKVKAEMAQYEWIFIELFPGYVMGVNIWVPQADETIYCDGFYHPGETHKTFAYGGVVWISNNEFELNEPTLARTSFEDGGFIEQVHRPVRVSIRQPGLPY